MGMLKTIGLAVIGVSLAAATWAQVPESRFVMSRDVDFYGADLDPVFDTTLNACMAQCAADQACAAFTFNARASACFPKRSTSDRTAYDGAVSGVKIATEPSILVSAPGAGPRSGVLGGSNPNRGPGHGPRSGSAARGRIGAPGPGVASGARGAGSAWPDWGGGFDQ